MFTAKRVMFLYSVSPVHMGTGAMIGPIDNPIQRERHTGHPVLAGSGLKGALREVAEGAAREGSAGWSDVRVNDVFGPPTEKAHDFAGALSVSDAQIVLFPVRCLRQSYVYATCPTALQRLGRMLGLAGVDGPGIVGVGEPGPDEALVTARGEQDLPSGQHLVLEAFAFAPRVDDALAPVASWLASHALPSSAGRHFRDKVERHLLVLHDDRFNHFVQHATFVEPHVRISDETGTADDGGLFYTENAPPECLFAALLMASHARRKGADQGADDILREVGGLLDGRMVQVGGDATTGRGLVLTSVVG